MLGKENKNNTSEDTVRKDTEIKGTTQHDYNQKKHDYIRMLPGWYQELSSIQKMLVETLQDAIVYDSQEGITARTSRIIARLGVLPRPADSQIEEAIELCDRDSILFLLHMYRLIRTEKCLVYCTGEVRDYFSVNERLILSGIVHLLYYWTIVALQERLFRFQDEILSIEKECEGLEINETRQKKKYSSPYLEPHPASLLHKTLMKRHGKIDHNKQIKLQRLKKGNGTLKKSIFLNDIKRQPISQTKTEQSSFYQNYFPWPLVPGVKSYRQYWKQFFGKYTDGGGSLRNSKLTDDMTEQVKHQLVQMANEGNPLAALPQVRYLPQVSMWIQYWQGFKMTKDKRDEFLRKSVFEWGYLQQHPRQVDLHNPFSHKYEDITWKNIDTFRKKAKVFVNKYHTDVRRAQVDDARDYWLPMYAEYLPSSRFLDIFYAYLPSKEADVLVNPGI